MGNPLVERATSSQLIGPDWAKNAEICDILNHDIGQAKEVVKGIRKRLGSKKTKVLLLALTLLETVMMNCGDIIHMHVAHKRIPSKMVKIAKKKADFRVREKILILIDTWQEAFGGARARYPQYYAAYQDLLHAGAVFPQRTESSVPLFSPSKTQSLALNSQGPHNSNDHQGVTESTKDSEFPTLSLTEIQNARGIMDVLSEMLNAFDPGKKEVLRQDVIQDLVQQCQTYKQRVIQLINSTSDESLLSQGLALNDDLQRLLAKHEAIASGTSALVEKIKTIQALIDVDDPEETGQDNMQSDRRTTSSSNAVSASPVDLLLPATPSNTQADSKMDLLSSEDFIPETEQSLAIVPVGEPQSTNPQSTNTTPQLDLLATDSFNSQQVNTVVEGPLSTPELQQNIFLGQQLDSNGTAANIGLPQHGQQQLPSYGIQENGALPPPPWETQPEGNSSLAAIQDPQQLQVTQVLQTDIQPVHGMHPQMMGDDQHPGMYVQSNQLAVIPSHPTEGTQLVMMIPQSYQGGQMVGMLSHPMQGNSMQSMTMLGNQFQTYASQAQYLEQSMYGLSMRDAAVNSPYNPSKSAYVPTGKPSKPEDKLFGDLVSIARSKPNK